MKIKFISVFLLLVFLTTIGVSAQSIQRLDGKVIHLAELTQKLQHIADSAAITGYSCAIFQKGKIVYDLSFGLRDKRNHEKIEPKTIMYGASFTKPIVAYAFLKLVEVKKLGLDVPLIKYLPHPLSTYPEWAELGNEPGVDKITARMILRHSSGIDIIDDHLKIVSPPGKVFDYSNVSFNFLGFIMEQHLSKKLEVLMEELVFWPLKMMHSSMIWKPEFEANHAVGHALDQSTTKAQKRTVARAAGSLVTTASDYALFLIALNRACQSKNRVWSQMCQSQIRIFTERGWGERSRIYTKVNDSIALGWGLGVGTFNSKYGAAYFHSGNISGWKNYFVSYPEKQIGIVLLSNSDHLDSNLKRILAVAIADTQSPLDWLGCND